jgi:hypothetical protein
MNEIIKELERVSNLIRENENKKARLEGERESLMNSLKEGFGVSSIREAKKKQREISEKKETLESEIEQKMEELREMIPEDM